MNDLMQNSIWLRHPKYDGYLFSPEGVCLSLKQKKPRILKPAIKKGYIQWSLNRKHKISHRIIAEIFCEKKEGQWQVNHKNGVKTDNRAENLEWCDAFYNHQHARDVLKKDFSHRKCERSNFAKLNKETVIKIYLDAMSGIESQAATARRYGVSQCLVSQIKLRKIWKEYLLDLNLEGINDGRQ